MKKTLFLLLTFSVFFFSSCQDVVDIPLDNQEPKLVIDAAINWEKGTIGATQTIKLTTTTDFYTNTIPVVSGASVSVINSSNVVFNFIEKPNTGEYICTNFVPVINEVYTLNILNKGQTYSATEKMIPVAPIINVTQTTVTGFGGNILKLNGNFIDPPNIDNYYLFSFKYAKDIRPKYKANEDKFFNGNPYFSIDFKNDLNVGDQLYLTHFGISKEYFNYIKIIIELSGTQGGAPFSTPSATAKGNIKNTTDFNNFPLGYFRLCETSSKTYIVQ
ncbi:MAG: DUF4249 domain-containing protein [Flavobacterium sp.]|nr:DUF4249 domain-containing protein [Flavobacterium sp.]